MEEEAEWDSDSAEAPSEDDEGLEAEVVRQERSKANKERRRANGIENVQDQYDALSAAEGRKRAPAKKGK